MINIRQFPNTSEVIAKNWRQNVLTNEDWKVSADEERRGELKGHFVRSNDHSGYAKPGPGVAVAHAGSCAAHEKIASDLAYDLSLPVPPVLLWERPDAKQDAERYCCVTLVPFLNVWPWDKLLPNLTMRFAKQLTPYASNMIAFDTWVGNADRANPGNLLVSEDVADPNAPVLRVAYIDFANSLSHGWSSSAIGAEVECVVAFPAGLRVDMDQLAGSIERIERLNDETIRTIVTRIPDHFAPAGKRDIILEALLARKALIREAIRKTYTELK